MTKISSDIKTADLTVMDIGKPPSPSHTPSPILTLGDSVFRDYMISKNSISIHVLKKFGLPLEKNTKCPVCGKDGLMCEIIAHLNNKEGETHNDFDHKHGTHNWTFKQIGLWLKGLGY